jgi:hypothetical protein
VVDNPAGVQPAAGRGGSVGRPGEWCETTNPYRGQTQFKASGSYPLPAAFAISGVFQSLPGIPINATYAASNASVAPSLGRNLGACGSATGPCSASTNVSLIEPFTEFEPRLEQVDLRVTKTFKFGRARLQGQVDLYNVLNANNVLAENGTYGAQWLRPQQVLGARIWKFGAQLDF